MSLDHRSAPLVSICITTHNRATLLSQTLASFLAAKSHLFEIVVIDSNSTDETSSLLCSLSQKYPNLTAISLEDNVSLDQGFELAIRYAKGTYCWLFPDDDLAVPDYFDCLLAALSQKPDLLVLNLQCYTRDLSVCLHDTMFPTLSVNNTGISYYNQASIQDFWLLYSSALSYIGSIVIRRDLWPFNRDESFYGTYFCHFSILLLISPSLYNICVLHQPLIKYRSANSSWTANSFKIWNILWPRIVWSSNSLTSSSKNGIVKRFPWQRPLTLLKSRAQGEYNLSCYYAFIHSKNTRLNPLYLITSILPVTLLATCASAYLILFRKSNAFSVYNLIMSNTFLRRLLTPWFMPILSSLYSPKVNMIKSSGTI